MQMMIQILKLTKKKLYTVFIDFSKAFDKVWRVGLWHKLLKTGIDGRFLDLIKNMYHNIKSKITVGTTSSEEFDCYEGVRQGENLSPLLFSIYLNDLEQHLFDNSCNGFKYELQTNITDIIYHFIILLYADDVVMFSQNPNDLQKSLNVFFSYCKKWRLKVNLSKTKIIIFGSGPAKSSKLQFTYGAEIIHIVDTYDYLGIKFHRNGRLVHAIKALTESATKAMYCLLKKARNVNLPLDCLFDAFDVMVAPILLYGAEIWGYENLDIIEKIHLKFLNLASGLKNSTPTFMLYGEFGREPLTLKIHKRLISYWHNIASDNTLWKPSQLIYNCVTHIPDNISTFPWLRSVKNILDNCGLSYVFLNPSVCSTPWLISMVENIYKAQFLQTWRSNVNSSPKGLYYKYIKSYPKLEKYLLLQKSIYYPILKLITTNHKLPIETGRWLNIPREDRKCPLCNSNTLGDEFHYLFKCKVFCETRQQFLNEKYLYSPNMSTLKYLLSSNSIRDLKGLARLLANIYNAF